MSEWYDRVSVVENDWDLRETLSWPDRDYGRKDPGVIFCREKRRRNRNRYYVLKVIPGGLTKVTNALILYQKNRNAWAVFVVENPTPWLMSSVNGSMMDPVKRYRTLAAAKMALMLNPLDRVGAEIDAICEATNGSEKSSNAGSSGPPI